MSADSGRNVDEVEERLQRLEARVDLHDELLRSQTTKRKPFSQSSRSAFRSVVARTFGGMCPCCGQTRIVDEAGNAVRGVCEFDHFKGRHRNLPEDGWAICNMCNDGFEGRRMEHHDYLAEFRTFQRRLTSLR
jgi:hypothetical protein